MRGAVVLLGMVLAFGVLEVGLRLLRPHSRQLHALLYSPAMRTQYDHLETTPELLASSFLGHHPYGDTPGFVLNSRGFRTDEYAERKGQGVFRVIALGDSFTFDSFGVPIDQMWHQVLERELAAATGREVEVLSLSAPAVGPRFELRLWELEGLRLDPDLVILGFFVGNDFTDESGVRLERGVDDLAVRSLTFRLLRNLVRLRRGQAARPAAAPPAPRTHGGYELPGYAATYDPTAPSLDRAAFLRIERSRLLDVAGPDEERFAAAFAETAPVVERLARSVEQTGAPLVVLLMPDRFQVDDRLLARLRPRLPAGELDLERPQRRLSEFLASRDVPHLDLLDPFRAAAAGGEELYKAQGTHWSARGNRLAGELLASFLLRHDLGPRPAPARPGAASPPETSAPETSP